MGVSDRVAIFTKDQPVTFASSRPMTLDQFLKFVGVVGSGGQAKLAIQDGYVMVNGELETRRGRKLITRTLPIQQDGESSSRAL